MAAEGGLGIVKRLNAWIHTHKFMPNDLHFVLGAPVQVTDEGQVAEFVKSATFTQLKPSLVVFDTFARCFVGGDENSAKDVGEFVLAVQDFQQRVGGAAILLVHHTGKPDRSGNTSDIERGSSALRGAADAMFLLKNTRGGLVVECTKQKDDEKAPKIPIRLEEVQLGNNADGEPVTSWPFGLRTRLPTTMSAGAELRVQSTMRHWTS